MDRGPVVFPEAAQEADVGTVEAVDVLVVVPHRQDRQLAVAVGLAAAGQRRDQAVLIAVDVLVLVDQDVAVTGEDTLAQLIGREARLLLAVAFEEAHGGGDQGVEVGRGAAFRRWVRSVRVGGVTGRKVGQGGEGGAGEPHRQPVVGLDRDPAGVVADQLAQPAAQLEGGVAVETQHQHAARQHPLDPQQIGTAMGHHSGLAGAGAGEHQQVAADRCRHQGDLARVGQLK